MQSARKAEAAARDLDGRAVALRRSAEKARQAAGMLQDGVSEQDHAALPRAVASWTTKPAGGGWDYASRAATSWRGLHLRPVREDGRVTGVDIDASYTTIGTVPVAAKLLRRGHEVVANEIAASVERYLMSLPQRIEEWEATADRLAHEAEQARAAAEGTAFPDQEKLEATIIRLAEVDAIIAVDAENDIAKAA